jgi:Ca-activated chloride channel family protein
MGVEDAVPDRLGVAVECAGGLLQALGREPGGRAAVVAFAGRGVLRCPLTENLGAVDDALKALRPGEVKPGGTDLGAALEAAVDAFDETEPAEGRTIVLLTDGEDHAGAWNAELPRLKASKIIVHAVAIGDAQQGHPVPVRTKRGATGEVQSLRHLGQTVLSTRSDEALEAVTKATSGALVRVGLASADLASLYDERIAPIARRKREALRVPERVDRYAFFVLGALAVGLGTAWPGLRRFPTLALLVLFVVPGAAPSGETAASAVKTGQELYASGRYPEALLAFERAVALAPTLPVPRYNAGAALFQLGRYREAGMRYHEARDRAGAALRIKIDFALGNVAVAEADYGEAVRWYDSCVQTRMPGAEYTAVRRDAGINRAYAERRRPPPEDAESGNRRSTPKTSESPNDQGPRDRRDAPTDGSAQGPGGSQSRKGSSPRSNSPRGKGQAAERGDTPQADSPEGQLDEAVSNVRQARQRRLADESSSVPDAERKDW